MRINGPSASASVATRILGIDPGLRSTGFGLIDTLGSQLRYVASGCIKTGEGSLPERLKIILDGIREVIATYKPDQAAVEIIFVNVNPQSTLLLGQARGAAICGAVSCDLPVAEYTALPRLISRLSRLIAPTDSTSTSHSSAKTNWVLQSMCIVSV